MDHKNRFSGWALVTLMTKFFSTSFISNAAHPYVHGQFYEIWYKIVLPDPGTAHFFSRIYEDK